MIHLYFKIENFFMELKNGKQSHPKLGPQKRDSSGATICLKPYFPAIWLIIPPAVRLKFSMIS